MSDARPPSDLPTDGPRPTPPHERIVELDVLRGLAIFGILLVNVPFFAEPVYRAVLDLPWPAPADRWAADLVTLLAEGKFYTLFSLLFGTGLALQLERARGRAAPFVPLYVRRLLVLLAFGLAHAFLLWWGDILTYYALLGFVLLAVRRAPPALLLRRAALFAALPLILTGAFVGLEELAGRSPEGTSSMEAAADQTRAGYEEAYRRALEAYRGPDALAMIPQRIADWAFATLGSLLNGFVFLILAMFLVGLAAGKSRIPQEIGGNLSLLRAVFAGGLLLGAIGNVVYLLASRAADPLAPGALGILATAGYVVGAPALCLAYASGLLLLLQRPAWRARLAPLAAVGRTALSNYLLQTLVMTTLVYGYGFGLYGRIGPAAGLAIAVALFALQIPLSVWWLRRFRYGPFEWAWRSLTYGRPQRLRAAERE